MQAGTVDVQTAGGYVQLGLGFLQVALEAAQKSGLAQEIIADLEAAIARLLKVVGTDVTYQQLQDLRVTKEW